MASLVETGRDNLFGFNDKDNSPRWRSAEQSLPYFHGELCKICGNNIRNNFSKGGHHYGECVTCEKIRSANRRAWKKNGQCDMTTEEKQQERNIYADCVILRYETGINYQVHHIQPYEFGGVHHPDNLIVLHPDEHIVVHNLLRAITNKQDDDYQKCLDIVLAKRI